jgi:hypothetical protein
MGRLSLADAALTEAIQTTTVQSNAHIVLIICLFLGRW